MEVKIIPCLNDNYSYLIFDKNKKNACVIDPSESEPIVKIIEKNEKLYHMLYDPEYDKFLPRNFPFSKFGCFLKVCQFQESDLYHF